MNLMKHFKQYWIFATVIQRSLYSIRVTLRYPILITAWHIGQVTKLLKKYINTIKEINYEYFTCHLTMNQQYQ